jgi:uncharacterized repeat protein (TIGR03803 family)
MLPVRRHPSGKSWSGFSCYFRRVFSVLALAPLLAGFARGQATEKVLYSFQGGNDGASPQAGLIADSAGNLYGTTSLGGAGGYGTVFELTPSIGGWKEALLYTFSSNDGANPEASLIFDGPATSTARLPEAAVPTAAPSSS